jgi:hypothetical protein
MKRRLRAGATLLVSDHRNIRGRAAIRRAVAAAAELLTKASK